MTGDQREKLDRWTEAYLDGRLNAAQLSQYNELLRRSPSLQAEIELQRRIDETLKRRFTPPAASEIDESRVRPDSRPADTGAESTAPAATWRGISFRRVIKISAAACLLVFVGFAGYFWFEISGGFEPVDVRSRAYTLTEMYRIAEEDEFRASWKCKDEREFATTFHQKLGQALAMASPPEGVVPTGITYIHLEDGNIFLNIEVVAKVKGRGVVVVVDAKGDGERKCMKVEDGLSLFVKETEHLILREVTPLDHATMLDLLDEIEIPDEWKADSSGYMRGGRRQKGAETGHSNAATTAPAQDPSAPNQTAP